MDSAVMTVADIVKRKSDASDSIFDIGALEIHLLTTYLFTY